MNGEILYSAAVTYMPVPMLEMKHDAWTGFMT